MVRIHSGELTKNLNFMDINEIKKALYREKPNAFLNSPETDEIWKYRAWLADGTLINFEVPISDMGENKFEELESAQLLIRWLVSK